MLVLTRKANESIVIGDNITVTLLQCRGDRARIGIEAPAEVKIRRSELGVLQAPEGAPAKSETAPDAG